MKDSLIIIKQIQLLNQKRHETILEGGRNWDI